MTSKRNGSAASPAVETHELWKTFGEGETAVHAVNNVSVTIDRASSWPCAVPPDRARPPS
jgi:hypothetical protein